MDGVTGTGRRRKVVRDLVQRREMTSVGDGCPSPPGSGDVNRFPREVRA